MVARPTIPVVELLRYLHSDRGNAEPLRNLTETVAGRTIMNAEQPTIIYTLTDEAPLLATYAFLPVIRAFADAAGIDVKTSDISVAARILAEFSTTWPKSSACRTTWPNWAS